MENVIEISHLSKSFGEVKAVQNLSFQVRKGELFAFLGVNGAGKSTTISMLCGQLKKDEGSIFVCGQNIDRGMEQIAVNLGVVFQNSVLDKALTVKENLKSRAALYGIKGQAFTKRLQELTHLLLLKDILSRPVGKLSGGQRRRADIARALLHQPQILILDEPTTGLDPQTRKLLWDVVERLREEQKMTVFLTTHYMEEAAEADYIVILESGKIAAEGTPLALKNEYTGDFITVYTQNEEEISRLGVAYQKASGGFRLQVSSTAEATKLIASNPQIFVDYEVTKGKMDDVFLAVTGRKLEGGLQ